MARERTFAEAARGLFFVSRVLQFIKHIGCLFLAGSKCIIYFPAGTFREHQLIIKIPLMSCIFSVFVVHISFSLRKFLAALVLALHLTPGRRLRPTMEKYKELASLNQAPDSFQEALLHLLQDRGWSNSLEDLARSIEACKDNSSAVSDNVNKLLGKLLETLAWSGDFKLRDMAHRHELKFVMSIGDGGCFHKQPAVVKHQCIQLSLHVNKSSDEAVTVEQLKAGIDGLLKSPFAEEPCRRCDTGVKRTLSLSIQHGCDPDFITIVCDVPISFRAADFTISFSSSRYRVMAVVQWDTITGKASVSREREDGWWWHGVDRGQAPSFKYTAEQVAASRHFQDAAVLMAIRTSEENSAAAEEDEVEEDVVAEQGGVGQDDQRSAGLRGVAAVNEDNLDVDGQGEEVNFHPPRTSTQISESHGVGAEAVRSEDGGKRPSFLEREQGDNARGTQVKRKCFFDNCFNMFFSGLRKWAINTSITMAEHPRFSSVPLWIRRATCRPPQSFPSVCANTAQGTSP